MHGHVRIFNIVTMIGRLKNLARKLTYFLSRLTPSRNPSYTYDEAKFQSTRF